MTRLVLPLALVFALGIVLAAPADAAPVTGLVPSSSLAHGGVAVQLGFGVAVPVQRRPAPRVRHAHHPRGHWEVIEERVWVPGRVIGYDAYGAPVRTQGYHVIQSREIWVPHRRHARVRHARVRHVQATPYVHVTAGRRFR